MPHAHLVRACSWWEIIEVHHSATCSPCQGLFLVRSVLGRGSATPQWPVLGGDIEVQHSATCSPCQGLFLVET